MEMPLLAVLSLILTAAALIDLRFQRIPNFLTLPGILVSLVYSSATNGIDGFFFSISGVAVGTGILLIPWLMGCMGAGDAKLMGVVGGFLGVKGAFNAFLLIALVGGVYALILRVIHKEKLNGLSLKLYNGILALILTRQYVPDVSDAAPDAPKLCYGLAIALGTFLYIALNAMGYRII
jgi:prepilin peptidase CpaA